jgi:poly-gamma-glutamate synthase PgsB/CapB
MRWLKPDITVITNVREDHVSELGKAEQAARIFAAAIPQSTALATSEAGFMDVWEAAAKQKKLRLCYVDPREAGDCAFPENAACVLGIADCLVIDRTRALEAITDYRQDAGAFGVYSWKANSSLVFFADARAANDIESTNRLSEAALQTIKPDTNPRRILLLINREDRPDRSLLFMQFIVNHHKELNYDQYLCLGHAPLVFRNAMKREGINYRTLRRIEDLERVLEEVHGQVIYIFAMGNYGGKGLYITQWLETKRQEPDFRQIAEPFLKAARQ